MYPDPILGKYPGTGLDLILLFSLNFVDFLYFFSCYIMKYGSGSVFLIKGGSGSSLKNGSDPL